MHDRPAIEVAAALLDFFIGSRLNLPLPSGFEPWWALMCWLVVITLSVAAAVTYLRTKNPLTTSPILAERGSQPPIIMMVNADCKMLDAASSATPAIELTSFEVTTTATTSTIEASVHGELPFPAEHINGTFTVKYQNLETMSQKMLSSWCVGYGLARSGNKNELKKRLTAFSQDRSQWDNILPGATRTHRNPRATTAATQVEKPLKKRSARRRVKLFTGVDLADNEPVHHAFPVEVSRDTRTEAEITGMLSWARDIMDLYPYPPVPMEPCGTTSVVAASTPPLPRSSGLCASIGNAESDSTSLQESLHLATTTIQQLLAHVIIQSTRPVLSSPINNTPPSQMLLPPAEPGPPPPIHPMAPTPTFTTKCLTKRRTLILDDNTKISFAEHQIPDPPVVTFVTNIPWLNRIWDGRAEHPTHDSPLRIQGHPIPLKYWPKVYQYWKGEQWKGTKGKWFEWKVVVHRYRQGTPAQFWEEFSENGKNMSYTAIVARLAQQREAADLALSKKAVVEYGTTFAEHFSYRRGSDIIILSKPAAVARRYRQLHGQLVPE